MENGEQRATAFHRSLTLLLLSALAAVACEGRPVPLTAAKGSTVLIPIGGGGTTSLGDGAKTGYGTVDTPDPQRGRLRLWLEDEANCNTPDLDSPRELTVRAVTRVTADPASFAGLSQGAQGGEQAGQLVVIADVKSNAPSGPFAVCVKRYTLSSWNATQSRWEEQPAAQSASYSASLTVLNVVGASTPFEANVGIWQPLDALGVQFDFTPRPRLRFEILTPPNAGALHVVVSYPTNRAAVWSVLAEPLGESVAWDAGALVTFTETAPGVLDIRALVPEGVDDPVFSIVFDLTQPGAAPPVGGPLQGSEFVFSTVEAWDLSGAPVSAVVGGRTIL